MYCGQDATWCRHICFTQWDNHVTPTETHATGYLSTCNQVDPIAATITVQSPHSMKWAR